MIDVHVTDFYLSKLDPYELRVNSDTLNKTGQRNNSEIFNFLFTKKNKKKYFKFFNVPEFTLRLI